MEYDKKTLKIADKYMSTRKKALLAVIVGDSIFGFSFLFSKVALNLTMPSVMLAARFTVAFLVLNLIVLAGKHIKKKNGEPLVAFSLKGKPKKPILLLALFQPVIYFFAESYGIDYTSSALAGTIIAVIPIAGLVCDMVLMGVKVTKKQAICSVASVIGVAVTTLGAEAMKASALGIAMLMVAVVTGALFYVFSKKAGAYYNPLERTYVMFGIGSAAYLTFALFQSAGKYDTVLAPALTSPSFWGCILYLAVVSSVIAFLLLNFGTYYISVSEASLFSNFTTVISIVAGVVILQESFTPQQVIGAVMILASVYISSVQGGEKQG